MTPERRKGIRASFGNAFTGFRSVLQTERNMKIHFVAGSMAILASIVLKISAIEWVVILLTISAVIVSELFNTAVECVVDLASPHENDLARKAKDISASAVLASAACSVIIGLIIFLPKIIQLFMQ